MPPAARSRKQKHKPPVIVVMLIVVFFDFCRRRPPPTTSCKKRTTESAAYICVWCHRQQKTAAIGRPDNCCRLEAREGDVNTACTCGVTFISLTTSSASQAMCLPSGLHM